MYDTSTGKHLSIDAHQIQECMDDLRDALVGIGATYEKDNADFICVLDDKTEPIPQFNLCENRCLSE